MIKSTLLKATKAAGLLIKEYAEKGFSINQKDGLNNPVTEADLASEDLIISIIRAEFPDHYILTEEAGNLPTDSNYKWIIDPIDGTVNFAHLIPLCCVSIGVEKDGEVLMGAIYNPFIDEFYFAEKGKGAFCNDKPIGVSAQKNVSLSCLVTGFPYTYVEEPNGALEVFARFVRAGVSVRRLGSAAMDLCWVACGRFDGYFEQSLKPWDSAAGFLLVNEAGGKVTNFEGDDYSPYDKKIIATNGTIHDELFQWLHKTN
ncbi:MAG: inositol monophosphatase [Chitinophagaceae bacterium]|nr:inositol monophosphatase [Chitinophagaceae bacterium]